MGLVAARAAGRMQARQNYRTMSRMQRRRSYIQSKTGMREDFSSGEEPAEAAAPAPAPAPAPAAYEPEYVGELERLAQLRDQGIISDEEFEAKKKQILGI
jgi:Short C-terminal domain